MPYIKEENRKRFDEALRVLFSEVAKQETTPGDLNYLITSILLKFEVSRDRESYDTWNSIVGVLECAKLELYRRHIASYEDLKIIENGDVF